MMNKQHMMTMMMMFCVLLLGLAGCEGEPQDTEDTLGDVTDMGGPDEGPVEDSCGLWVCGETELCCNYACIDASSSADHCGACGNACGGDETCVNGQCTCGDTLCASGQSCCGAGTCVDLFGDPNHCGGCGVSCGLDERCIQGACACAGPEGNLDVCAASETCCPGLGCVDTDVDVGSCGACGVVCGPGEQCIAGACSCGDTTGSGAEACGAGEACCGSPATCRPVEDTVCSCGTSLCGSGQSCCDVGGDDVCVSTWRDAEHCGDCGVVCGPGERCHGGECLCYDGLADCNNDETDGCEAQLALDATHCGACGIACASGEVCHGQGECTLSCQRGLTACDGRCVDLRGDGDHCGACASACPSGEVCDGTGQCDVSCQVGLTQCGKGCYDLRGHREHCGACGASCAPGEVCDGTGQCGLTCQPGLRDCSGMCVPLRSDRFNCGACGNACAAGEVCDGEGQCALTCAAGQTECGGYCVDVFSNRVHCGACGNTCAAGEVCDSGTCVVQCPETTPSYCGGLCVDTETHRLHCGGCNQACEGQQRCVEGACVLECPQGVTSCGASCVDLQSDAQHCGVCDAACPLGKACLNGQCCDPSGCEGGGQLLGSTGGSGACSLGSSGELVCWGDSTETPELLLDGNGAPITDTVTGGIDVLAFGGTSNRRAHSCLISAGEVWCWGGNRWGQLGDGTTTDRPAPTRVVGLPADVVDVKLGDVGHTCALIRDGRVYCWGYNDLGMLGNGLTTPSSLPVQVVGLPRALQIGVGEQHSCALVVENVAGASENRIYCWGDISFGAVGCGSNCDTTLYLEPLPVPVVDAQGETGGYSALVGTEVHNCALRNGSEVWCWGGSDPLAASDDVGVSTPILDASGATLSNVTRLAAGGSHTCALTQAGEVLCWGQNTYGQLGHTCDGSDPATTCMSDPVARPVLASLEPDVPLNEIVQISVGKDYSCAEKLGVGLLCWGTDKEGQLGDGPDSQRQLLLPSAPIALESEQWKTCALLAGGDVYCWGDNEVYQPVLRASGATHPRAGFDSACRVNGGAVECRGLNSSGQLGDGTTNDSTAFVTVSGIDGSASSATSVVRGGTHACALLDTGAVRCWGANTLGQLGDGSTTQSSVPVDVVGIDGTTARATTLAAGSNTTCALLDTGAVLCWGDDNRGALGDGDTNTSPSSTPVPVVDLDGVTHTATDIAFSGKAGCAVLDTGRVMCWGARSPLPFQGSDSAPVLVEAIGDTLAGAANLFMGSEGTRCSRLSDGALACWGLSTGLLRPEGSLASPAIPFITGGVDGTTRTVNTFSVGYDYVCAAFGDGTYGCWGNNNKYALGWADLSLRPVPVALP